MSNLKNIMNKVLETVCVFIFAFITIVGTYQIVVRYVFNSPSTVSEELLTYSFTWLALLAAALVFGKKEHMAMTYFADKIKGKKRIVLSLAMEVVVMVFAISVLIFGGISITRLTMTQITASLGIPMGYVYAVVPISGVITVIYNILNISELFKQIKNA